jgi:hypothetical protein
MPKPFDPHNLRIPRSLDLTHMLPEFESLAEAEARKQALERGLRRANCVELANQLASCTSGPLSDFHCLSGACPVCMRAWRRWFFAATSRMASKFRSGESHKGCVVSLVPRDSQALATQLQTVDLKIVALAIRRGLGVLDLDLPVVGGLDISFNEDARHIRAAHFQVHANFAVLGIEDSPAARRRLRQALASAIPLEPTSSRPIMIQPLRDWPRQLSYVLKSTYVRRLSIVDKRGRANTLRFPLKMAQAVEVATVLDTHTVFERLLIHGASLSGSGLTRDSQPRRHGKL